MSIENGSSNDSPEINDAQPTPSKGRRLQQPNLRAAVVGAALASWAPRHELPEGQPEVPINETGTTVHHDQEPQLAGANVAGAPPPEAKYLHTSKVMDRQ